MPRMQRFGRAESTTGKRQIRIKLLMLGIGAATGMIAGMLLKSVRDSEAGTRLSQRGRKYARRSARKAGRTARSLTNTTMGKVRGIVSGRRADETEVDPVTITHRVQTELGEDPEIRHLPRLNVNTEPGGIVYLRGAVPEEQIRQKAFAIAFRVRGVQQVINEIEVVSAVRAASGVMTTDEADALAGEIESSLREDQRLSYAKHLQAHVEPSGTVYLRGTVRNDRDRERAERIARKVSGETTIINDLAVISPRQGISESETT